MLRFRLKKDDREALKLGTMSSTAPLADDVGGAVAGGIPKIHISSMLDQELHDLHGEFSPLRHTFPKGTPNFGTLIFGGI